MVSFNDIPLDIRTPGQFVEFENSRAVQGLTLQPHIALIAGQQLAAGSSSEGTPELIGSVDNADTFWGIGSHMANMARAFKFANPQTELWGISLDDAGGSTANTRLFTVTGTATADGTYYAYIAGHRITVTITSGDVQNVVAAALNAAILAHLDYLRMPFSTAVVTNVVTLTARNKGTQGALEDVRANYQQGEFTPAGTTVVISTGIAGAGDPTLATVVTAMGDKQYHTITTSNSDATNVGIMEVELVRRFGPMVKIEGQLFYGIKGNLAALSALGNARNSPHSTAIGFGGLTAGIPESMYVGAASMAAIDAKQTGIDPARPRQTLTLPGVQPPEVADQFDQSERNILLTDGVATVKAGAGGILQIERIITTYQTSPAGAPDPSYLDITTLRTLSFLRFSQCARIALKYPRHKLANDGTLFAPGSAIVTPSSIRSELLSLFKDWELAGLVEGFEQFKDDLIVVRSTTDVNRVDVQMSPDLINQFRVFAGQIQFLL